MSNLAKFESDLLSIVLSRNTIELTEEKIDENQKTSLEKRLKNRLKTELDFFFKNPEIKQAIINSILKYQSDWGIRNQIWPRIQNSLRKFHDFCFSEKFNATWELSRKDLFKLISDNSNSKCCVTTPAMLVLEAILYSHQEWARPFYHDIWSAGQARADILRRITKMDTEKRGVRDSFINKIVTMISFQNIFRNGLLDPMEVGVWDGKNTCITEDVRVRKALIREVFRLWAPEGLEDKKIALSAIAACSLSHEGRISLGHNFLKKCDVFKQLYDCICIDGNWYSDEEAILYYFEYANYMFIRGGSDQSTQQQREEFQQFAEEVLEKNIPVQGVSEQPSMIFLSFGRFWSNREIDNFYKNRMNFAKSFEVEKNAQLKTLQKALLDTSGKTRFAHLKIDPKEAFKLFFDGLECSPSLVVDNDPKKIWPWIDSAIQWIQRYRPWRFDGADYIPFSAVDRVLRVLEKIIPDAFIVGRIIWVESSAATVTSHGYTITLPRDCKSIKNTLEEFDKLEKKLRDINNILEIIKDSNQIKSLIEEKILLEERLNRFNTNSIMIVARYAVCCNS